MSNKSWHLCRRTMLRGLGAAVALPWLEAMQPAWAAPGTKPPLRMVFLYRPLGSVPRAYKGATGEGRNLRPTPMFQPLEPIKDQLLILDGLDGRREGGATVIQRPTGSVARCRGNGPMRGAGKPT